MVVEIPTAQKTDTNSVGSTTAPWEAVSSDSSSNSSEGASAVGTPRQAAQRKASQASEPSVATLGDITPSRQRWSDLSESPEKAAAQDIVISPWPEDDGCTVTSRASAAKPIVTVNTALPDFSMGDLQEDDEPDVADVAQSGGQASSGKRRSRRRRRHAKTSPAGAMSPTSGTLLQGNLSVYSPNRASVHPELEESMISWPHTPSKFAGLSTQLTGTPLISAGGRSVVTWNDLLGADRTLCPQSPNMAHGVNALSPLAQVQPATPEHLRSMPLVTAPSPVHCTTCPSPVHAQRPLCEAGARTPWTIPSIPGSWGCQSWPVDYSVAPCAAVTGPPVAPPTAPPTGLPMASHVPSGYQYPPEMQGDALMHWLRANGLEHNSTSDLAEQLRAMAPEAYED
mmetsp:Transcript_21375/g.40938  ORF Transcript_21375/g.40938 Transcript_21375/m.40938 type:complete len:397 (-) Transcript_21375:73-1263(-)